MVKTFYDKRVEERGIERGIEKGIEISRKSKREFVKNLLLSGVTKEVILAAGDFTVSEIDEILLEIKN